MSYFDDNEDRIVYGIRRKPAQWQAVCKRCGTGGLKWRDDRFYEDERAEHNRLKEHHCAGALDDFDEVPT
ncbi:MULTISPECIES: hypothetical protein [unclassified Janthinobacterium]|uniref:hypothetical protein n=1 Tax=unclassified Janthinobacterium TaxID=2610881 RepID=UPI00034D334D|nr:MULTISPECIES: hypothetical protein [unclassified Janthinobacterium]MEC5161691.1 hypothetical protein [Janthinobacterium sp. CG_S6]